MLIYCDSMILIYFLDHEGPMQMRVVERLAAAREHADQIVVSDLTRLECRVTPIRLGDTLTLSKYDAFFSHPEVLCFTPTPAVYDHATEIRAKYTFKTLDALHLATAVEYHCDEFLTNDFRLADFKGIRIEML